MANEKVQVAGVDDSAYEMNRTWGYHRDADFGHGHGPGAAVQPLGVPAYRHVSTALPASTLATPSARSWPSAV